MRHDSKKESNEQMKRGGKSLDDPPELNPAYQKKMKEEILNTVSFHQTIV